MVEPLTASTSTPAPLTSASHPPASPAGEDFAGVWNTAKVAVVDSVTPATRRFESQPVSPAAMQPVSPTLPAFTAAPQTLPAAALHALPTAAPQALPTATSQSLSTVARQPVSLPVLQPLPTTMPQTSSIPVIRACSNVSTTAGAGQTDPATQAGETSGVATDVTTDNATTVAVSAALLASEPDRATATDSLGQNPADLNTTPLPAVAQGLLLAKARTSHTAQAPPSSLAPAANPDDASMAAKKRAAPDTDSVSAQAQQSSGWPPNSAEIQVQITAGFAAADVPVVAISPAASSGPQPVQPPATSQPVLPLSAAASQTLRASGPALPATVSSLSSSESSSSQVQPDSIQQIPAQQTPVQQTSVQQIPPHQPSPQHLGTQLSQRPQQTKLPQIQLGRGEPASPERVEQTPGPVASSLAATLPPDVQPILSDALPSSAPAASEPVSVQAGAISSPAPLAGLTSGPKSAPAAPGSRRSPRVSDVQPSQAGTLAFAASVPSPSDPARSAATAFSPPELSAATAIPAATFAMPHGSVHVPASAAASHAPMSSATTLTQLGGADISVDTLQVPTPVTRTSALEVGFHDATLGWLSVRASTDGAGDLHAALSGRTQAATAAVDTMLPALGRYLQTQNVAVHSVSATVAGAVAAPSPSGAAAGFAQDSSRGNTSSSSTTPDSGNAGAGQRQGSGERSPRQQPEQAAWLPEQSFVSPGRSQRAERLSYAASEQASVLSVRI